MNLSDSDLTIIEALQLTVTAERLLYDPEKFNERVVYGKLSNGIFWTVDGDVVHPQSVRCSYYELIRDTLIMKLFNAK